MAGNRLSGIFLTVGVGLSLGQNLGLLTTDIGMGQKVVAMLSLILIILGWLVHKRKED